MARRTKEEALQTREQLLDAAERVFLERGVGHASLAEVADAAGVTRGAIYHHFDSKAELFEAMVERAEMPIDAAFESAAASDDDPLDSLGKRALNALLQLASSSRVRRVFEVVFLRCEYTDELATVEQRHLREREQCLYLCGESSGQSGRTGSVAARHRYANGEPPALCAHRRADARLGAGTQEL